MGNPYTGQTISGYNQSPPSDAGATDSENEITWAKHKTKLGDPVKTLAEAIDTELSSAFGLLFGQDIAAQSSDFTVLAADQGKFFTVTGTTTVTLTAAATLGAQFPLVIANDGTGTVTIDPNGAETINGSATWALLPGQVAIITCDGSGWRGGMFASLDSSGNLGIGIAPDPGSVLHLWKATAGSVAASTDASLVIEAGAATYLQFLTPNTVAQGILFGDPESITAGSINYDHNVNIMTINVNDSERMRIYSTGGVRLGTTVSDPGVGKLDADDLLVGGVSVTAITTAKFTSATTGNYVEAVASLTDAEIGDPTASYTEQLKITMGRAGTYSVRIGIRETDAGFNVVGKIYKDGVTAGTERNPGVVDTWVWWNEDITVTAGQTIELWLHRGGGANERASACLAVMSANPMTPAAQYTDMTELNVASTEVSIYD